MGFYSPKEMTSRYAGAGTAKALRPTSELVVLAILAGVFIALGCVATNTAIHSLDNVGLARTLSAVLFPFGLCMVIITGAELFTGNSLMIISLLEGHCSLVGLLRNWAIVYVGNFVGSLLVAAGCALFGQLSYSNGGLAVYTIRLAATKCTIPMANALVLGILCNVLVCTAVLMAFSAQETPGRLLCAYIPVAFFVLCGFEHCVANMCYIPAGLIAAANPTYTALAAEAGVDMSALTVGNFLLKNLLPVTLGNILGGGGFASVMWFAWLRNEKKTNI